MIIPPDMKKELFYSQDGKFILIDAITKIIHTLGNLEEVFYHDSLKKNLEDLVN